jgi:hypothetical protein
MPALSMMASLLICIHQPLPHTLALWLSGYSDRLEIYFLREQEFESLRRRIFCLSVLVDSSFCYPECGEQVGGSGVEETGPRLRKFWRRNFWWRERLGAWTGLWEIGYVRMYRGDELISCVVMNFVLNLEFSSQLFEASVKHKTILEPDAYNSKGQYATAMTGQRKGKQKRTSFYL